MLKNKTIAITGARGRIGACLAEEVIKNNGKVLLGDIQPLQATQLPRNQYLYPNFFNESNSHYVQTDLTKPEEIERFIECGVKKFKKIDAAVHCAYPRSKQWGTKFEDLQLTYISEDFKNQLGSAIIFSQKIIKHFMEMGGGNLIHISSIQGLASPKFEHYEGLGMTSPIEYSAIKSGIISITKYLAKYYKNKNIRVNCVSPGGILDDQPLEFLNRYKKSCANKGMLDPIDIVNSISFLISDQSQFITGENITVDDGWIL